LPSPFATALLCHPASPCPAALSIEASAAFDQDGALVLHYRLSGQLDQLRLPAPQPASPADNLWQHTCLEAFIASGDGTDYQEFNFSPSGQWAHYAFTNYRERAADEAPLLVPALSFHSSANALELTARLTAPLPPVRRPLQIGLTAVIETRDGAKSYWALRHAASQPDFHLRQSFTLALNPLPT
jgi:hypothetical protein